jgi:hypothetical protein
MVLFPTGGLTGLVMGPVATRVHTMASVPL